MLRQMTGSLWRSAFVAALFAVHPLRAESVAWVSERKDVLSGFFFMLAMGAYVRYARNAQSSLLAKSRRTGNAELQIYYALTLVFFVLGLLAKSMVATLPFVLLLLDYWPLGRMREMQNAECRMQNEDGGSRNRRPGFWGLVREKVPLFAISAGACVVAALVPGLMVMAGHRVPLLERVRQRGGFLCGLLGANGFAGRIGGALIPTRPAASRCGRPAWRWSLLAVITAGAVAWRKKRPWLLTGWLWYLGMLVPVIGIIQISERCRPRRPVHLSAGNRLGPGGDLGGGGWERGLEAAAAGFGGIDDIGNRRLGGLRPRPDFVLARRRIPLDTRAGLHFQQP